MSFLYDLIDDVTKNLTEELERVKRERDAAIADLKHGDNCDICAHTAVSVIVILSATHARLIVNAGRAEMSAIGNGAG